MECGFYTFFCVSFIVVCSIGMDLTFYVQCTLKKVNNFKSAVWKCLGILAILEDKVHLTWNLDRLVMSLQIVCHGDTSLDVPKE